MKSKKWEEQRLDVEKKDWKYYKNDQCDPENFKKGLTFGIHGPRKAVMSAKSDSSRKYQACTGKKREENS